MPLCLSTETPRVSRVEGRPISGGEMIHRLLCVDPRWTVAVVCPATGPVVAGSGKGGGKGSRPPSRATRLAAVLGLSWPASVWPPPRGLTPAHRGLPWRQNLPQTLCPWWLAKGTAAIASDRAANGAGGVAVGGGPGLVEQRHEGIAGNLAGDMAEGAVATRPDLVSDLILRAADDQ